MRLAAHVQNVKFEHTVFALPFAYLGMLLAAGGLPSLHQFVWITVAMVGARTMGMSINRLADRELDARNPRTRQRPLATGRLTENQVLGATLAGLAALCVAAWQLNELTLRLLPIALVFLVGYHYTKRYTWLSHLFLGVTDSAAPVGAWIAVTNSFDLPALLLGIAVAAWVGGFDVLYSMHDVEFDRAHGLHSVPARFGPGVGVWAARASHLVMLVALVALGLVLFLGPLYWAGLALAAALLLYEHSLVRPDDLSRLDVAFFNVNGYLALGLFLFAASDRLLSA